MPIIRYPGSKRKLVSQIAALFPENRALPLFMASGEAWEYREPFFGCGAMGIPLFQQLPASCSAWINDLDGGIARLWQTVWNSPRELCALIRAFEPSVEKYEEFKRRDGERKRDPVQAGFEKLALHQMSFSGLGVKSGGPLGGKKQDNGAYTIDCRWNPESLVEQVQSHHKTLDGIKRLRITGGDFKHLVCKAPSSAFIYCDPPYVAKGPDLYKYSFTQADHERLAVALLSTQAKWALSYDDHPLIRELYGRCKIIPISVVYTTRQTTVARPKNQEIVILSPTA